jgi:hypothetical protein
VYDATGPSGGPGAKLAETDPITLSGSADNYGWRSVPVTAPVTLSAGTYWLAFLPDDSLISYRQHGSAGQIRYYSYTYGPLPATFSTSPSSASSRWSFYATLDEIDTTAPGANGLVGHWSFDGPDVKWAANKALDRSGNGNDGTLTGGVTRAIGKIGQGLSFDGTDTTQINTAADEADTLATFTACAWVRPDSLANPDLEPLSMIMSKLWMLDFDNSGRVRLYVPTSNVYPTTYGTRDLSAGRWNHICAIYRGIGPLGSMYLDGIDTTDSVDSGGGNGSRTSDNAYDFVIGSTDNEYAYNFDGVLDDVRVYNRALTAAEISALYNMGK